MLEVRNKTPFSTAMIPGMDKDGGEHAVVVVKGTFDLKSKMESLPVSDIQVPVVFEEEFYGKPGISSVRYDSDAALSKMGTDIVLLGHAYARNKRASQIDVKLQVGKVNKSVRVFGDRKWTRSIWGWRLTNPAYFERVPLVYERAFGGADQSDPRSAKHTYEERNPVGTGFRVSNVRLEEMPLPNLEDPSNLIESWKDKPAPSGFGFIGRDWLPRVKFAGTYDDRWQKQRAPFLPYDFDQTFFNSGPSDLIAHPHLKGGEPVQVVNASQEGELLFRLPSCQFVISVWIKGREKAHLPLLDTVVIEPNEKRVVLTWRATVPCDREFLYIDRIKISSKG